MRKLLCIDTKLRRVRRYQDKKCTETATLEGGEISPTFLHELEAFRLYGFTASPVYRILPSHK